MIILQVAGLVAVYVENRAQPGHPLVDFFTPLRAVKADWAQGEDNSISVSNERKKKYWRARRFIRLSTASVALPKR